MNLVKVLIEGVYAETQGAAAELAYYRDNWPNLVEYIEQLESRLKAFEADDYNRQQSDPFGD